MQSSLIARLELIAKALAMNDNFLRNILHYGVEDFMVAAGVAALTDLRDLIREAEGQKCADRRDVEAGEALYTALGEKP